MLGQVGAGDFLDGAAAQAAFDHPVVVEHGDAVGGEPDIALETGRTEAECERKRFERVFGGMGSGTPMAERDRGVESGGETLLH